MIAMEKNENLHQKAGSKPGTPTSQNHQATF